MRRVGATIRGFGDYKVGSNSLMRGGMSPPMITNSISNGAVIIRHREYLRDIFNSTNFSAIEFDLNPGLTASFPWLSQIAASFAQYRFRGLVFEFKTTSSDTVLSSSASTSLGTVVLATQYNALDSPFTNKFEMENWEYSVSTKPSLSVLHPVECAKSQTPVSLLWTRTGVKEGDERLYDLGNFVIATVGMQGTAGTSSIGELWVSYEIELYKPQFVEDVTTQSSYYTTTQFEDQFGTAKPVSGSPWGTQALISSNLPKEYVKNSNWFTTISGTNRRISIPDSIAKRFLILAYWRWDGAITLTSPTPAWVNPVGAKFCSMVTTTGAYNNTGFTSHKAADVITAGDYLVLSTIVEATSDQCTVEVNAFTWTGTPVNAVTNVIITEVCPDFVGLFNGD